jgi:ATP-dependent RNA helicase HelY
MRRERIRQIVDAMVDGQMSYEDLKALSFPRFRFALEQGFAPHHAGMIALFRQIVETLFEMGLVKMVFATETLALGINMPARSVVVEKLEKFNGVEHVSLTPGEFTQLTGRAGQPRHRYARACCCGRSSRLRARHCGVAVEQARLPAALEL